MRCTKLNQIPASPWKISDQTFAPVFHLLEVNLFDPSAAVQIQQPRRMLQHRPLLLWGKVAKRNFCCLGKGRQNDTDLKIATTGHLLRLLRSTRQGLKQRFGCFCSHIYFVGAVTLGKVQFRPVQVAVGLLTKFESEPPKLRVPFPVTAQRKGDYQCHSARQRRPSVQVSAAPAKRGIGTPEGSADLNWTHQDFETK